VASEVPNELYEAKTVHLVNVVAVLTPADEGNPQMVADNQEGASQ